MRSFLLLLLFTALFFTAGLNQSAAQINLDRISVSERGDEQGFVVRYHLTEMVDSFTVSQPSTDRIQMQLFASDIVDANNMLPALSLPPGDTVFSDFSLRQIPGGIGIDIILEEGNYLIARAYPDQNLRDLLLSLEYTTRSELEEITTVTEPLDRDVDTEETEPVREDDPDVSEEEITEQPERSVTLKFGVRAGMSYSNFLNKNYSNSLRSEIVIGVPAEIKLPVYVMPDVRLGIESGIYYYQLGIENPSEGFDAQFIKVDYLQLPVLAKFTYPLMDRVEPHLVVGPYFGFMVSSESETDTGRMRDMDNFTTEVDLGGKIGLGTDLILGNTVLNARFEYSVGFKPVFTVPEDREEIHSVVSLLVGITF